ncbi:hypothetical protein ABZ471_09625 [Streptomyces sp. NPDC005728]|uniref:hypothetical protein n=1 Tax=Streptomyces sp. NPDC005728 TaxID=3157054 RepID=UPI003404F429
MSSSSAPRSSRFPLKVTITAVCLVLAGGTWLWLDSAGASGACQELVGDKRVRAALGSGYRSDLGCSELGAAAKRATTGASAGKHSLQQARAMQNILLAMDDRMGTGAGQVDPALAVPFAEALADYADDTDQILTSVNVDYIRAETQSTSPWEDQTGVHMSISVDSLIHVVRGLSDSPAAYATVRDAATRHIAADFAATPRTSDKVMLGLRAKLAARILGSLDGVAQKVTQDKRQAGAEKWGADVVARLTAHSKAPPAYREDPAGHLLYSWKRELKDAGPKNPLTQLEAQSEDMTRLWARALGLEQGMRDSLPGESRDNAIAARKDTFDKLR